MSIRGLARYIRVMDKAVAKETAKRVRYGLQQADPGDLGLRQIVQKVPSIRGRAARRAVAEYLGDAVAIENRARLKVGKYGVVRDGLGQWNATSPNNIEYLKLRNSAGPVRSRARSADEDRFLSSARKELRGKPLEIRAWRGEDPGIDDGFSTDAGWYGRGRYFSGYRNMAEGYNKGGLVDADLKLNNPLYILKSREYNISSDVLGGITEIDAFGRAQRMTDIARRRGHDSVVKLTKVDYDDVADSAGDDKLSEWVSIIGSRKNKFGGVDSVAADEIVTFSPESVVQHRIPGRIEHRVGSSSPRIVLAKTVKGNTGAHIPSTKDGLKKSFIDQLDKVDDEGSFVFRGGFTKNGKPAVSMGTGVGEDAVLTREEAVAYINRAVDYPASSAAARKSLYSQGREVQNRRKNFAMLGVHADDVHNTDASDIAEEIMGNESFKLTSMNRLRDVVVKTTPRSIDEARELSKVSGDIRYRQLYDAGMIDRSTLLERLHGSNTWTTRRQKYGRSGLSPSGKQAIAQSKK